MRTDKARIYSHRGIGLPGAFPENSLRAFQACVTAGFSIETDIRSSNNRVYIGHDPLDDPEVFLSDLLSLKEWRGSKSRLALDVKQDGLLAVLPEVKFPHFYFDMSIPEWVKYDRQSEVCFGRLSEYEPIEMVMSQSGIKGLWLDGFNGDWFLNSKRLRSIIETFDREVVLVSPELHGRPHQDTWGWLAQIWGQNELLSICTDRPLEFWEMVNRNG